MEIFYSDSLAGNIIELPREESRHCVKVLRNHKGDRVTACTGDGNFYRCILIDDNPDSAVLEIEETISGKGGHDYYLEMAVAPTKNMDRFEWFVDKATEMGVDAIVPLLCGHSERKVFKKDRCERIIISAVKQSLKSEVPVLGDMTPFENFIEGCRDFKGRKFIAFCEDDILKEKIGLKDAVTMSDDKVTGECRAVCAIGPEGDFSAEEVCLALDNGFLPLSLGDSRLRTETAAILCVSAFYLNICKK